jgi:exodeoxyribonuclease VIII
MTDQTTQLTNEQHHAHPAIGSSDLKLFRRSPLHYWYRKHSPAYQPRPPSNAMQLGTALHLALLEPELYAKDVGTALTVPKTSAANKAAHAQHDAKYKMTFSAPDIEKITGMRDMALRHPVIAKVAKLVCYRELSLFVTDPTTGLQLKIRPDAITRNGWLLDIKTTSDARDAKFKWSVRDYGYDHQAAFYLKCLRLLPPEVLPNIEIRGQLLVLIENEAPYAARVVRIPDDVINRAAAVNEASLEAIAEHLQLFGPKTPWPAYEATIATLEL